MLITVTCCLCQEGYVQEVDLPPGWAHRYDEVDDDQGFCPKHAPVAAFAESQCPGCVGGWGDCPMWKAFAYSHERGVTAADYASLERGICPRRVNGTMEVSRTGIHNIDLSERAPAEAGAAFAQAIRDYCARYPSAA